MHNEAMSLGRGGVTLVSAATGVSGTRITEGMKEIKGEKEGSLIFCGVVKVTYRNVKFHIAV